MKENESQLRNADSEKARIRARYKGIDPSELDFIPAAPQENFYEDKREKRVAVYARVSTDDPRQTSSYELQKNHYTDVVSNHPGWKLVDIYAEIIVPYMIRLRLGDFIKECKNLLIYRLSDAKRCAKALFFVCEFRSTVSVTVRWVYDH